MVDFRSLVLSKRWDELAEHVSRRHGIEIRPNRLGDAIKPHLKDIANPRACKGWGEASWLCWLKLRAFECGGLPLSKGRGPKILPDSPWPVPMHVFFVALDETPEMLARLRNESPAAQPNRPTRSRLPKSMLKTITPIDTVARRVAPMSSPTTPQEGE